VGIGEFRVAKAPERLGAYGLGSCIVVVLWDPLGSGWGGLAHCMLPAAPEWERGKTTAKYCDLGIPALHSALAEAVGRPGPFTARLVGGATMFRFPDLVRRSPSLGERNAEASRAALEKLGLVPAGEECGGERGRSVEFDPGDGVVAVRSAPRGLRLM